MLLVKHAQKICLTIVVACACTIGSAQKIMSDFGEFTDDEIELKECSFDKEADAVVFFDKASANYNENYNLVMERRVRLKILKQRGIERGTIRIPYYSEDKFESIFGIEATILTMEGQQKAWGKLDRKLIYDKQLNKYISQVSFALPNVKVGSIIEYKYSSQMKNYGGLNEWVFQKDMPVVFSEFNLVILPNTEFAYTVYKLRSLPIAINPEKRNGSVNFAMNDIPGLRDEAYMDASKDYMQRVRFQFAATKNVEDKGYGSTSLTSVNYTDSWQKLAVELLQDNSFGSQLNKKLPGLEPMVATWAAEADPFTRMRSIHNYVRSTVNWNHVYGKYASDGIKTAWEKKTGSTGEINLLLINLLKASGLAAQPLLVSERDYGKIDTTYPYLSQFEKVIALVKIDDKNYFLDGTDHVTPSFIIPSALLNTTGFLVDKKHPALIKIFDKAKRSMSNITVIGAINNEGLIKMEASVNSFDYAKIERKQKYESNKTNYQKEFLDGQQLASLDTFVVSGLENDSLPIVHNTAFSYALNKTGDYYLLNYNLFTGISKNPFISEHRFSKINLGAGYACVLNGTFILPPNMEPEALPKSLKLKLPDDDMMMSRQIEKIGNELKIQITIAFKRTEYAADEYADVQMFYKKMVDLLNEPIVLKAKI